MFGSLTLFSYTCTMKATDLKIGKTYYYVRLAGLVSMQKMTIVSISESYYSCNYVCEGRNVKYKTTYGCLYQMFIPDNPMTFGSEGWDTNCDKILQIKSYEFMAADKPSMAKAIKGFYKYKVYSGKALYGKQSFLRLMNALKSL